MRKPLNLAKKLFIYYVLIQECFNLEKLANNTIELEKEN